MDAKRFDFNAYVVLFPKGLSNNDPIAVTDAHVEMVVQDNQVHKIEITPNVRT